ncbi:hypothetical protein KAT63_05065 [Candidatus Parcubacteria bacterium]|nr:hypothetical protein [Candidatus Parcubacteria bacterium]
MKKKIILSFVGIIAVVAVSAAMFAAFEAHVINVTAKIENALYVHPETKTFGTVFPQEYLEQSFFITTSSSFSATDQRRVLNIDYVIKQKPKPKPEKIASLGGIEAARDWCHGNIPDSIGTTYDPADPEWQAFLENCYPTLCPYLSKHSDHFPTTGPGSSDVDVNAFHDPEDPAFLAGGTINKDYDPADQWIVDLAVPCFEGMCAQDWNEFVLGYNSLADPDDYMLPPELESKIFGCDLWIEVTAIY